MSVFRGSDGSSPVRRIIGRYKARIAVFAGLSFAGALLEAALLVILTGVAMSLTAGRDEIGPFLGQSLDLDHALFIGGVILVARLGLNIVSAVTAAELTAKVTTEQRGRVARAYLGSSWAVQSAEPPGRLQELLTSVVGRVTAATQALSTGVTALLSLAALMLTSVVIDARAALAVVAVLVLAGMLLMPFRKIIKRLAGVWRQADLNFAQSVSELGARGFEMQVFGVRDRFEERIRTLTQGATTAQKHSQIATSSQSYLYMTLAYGAVLIGIAATRGVGFEDLASIGAILLLMLRSLSYGQTLANSAASLATYAPFLDYVDEVTDIFVTSPAPSGTESPATLTPIVATSLGYSYPDSGPAIRDFDFEIAQGEVVGVIGPSGSGKSTMAQVLAGLRVPSEGSLGLGGVDVREIDRTFWSDRVAVVPQEARLVTGTVADNIRFFRPGLSDEDLLHAAKKANLTEDLQKLPQGLETHVGAQGGNLSGGQRQRVSIARALAGRPEILILDEPTSSLDGANESVVTESIKRLRGEVTVVIIAHRMSTLESCDRVMVVESGSLTAFGTPSELMSESAFYVSSLSLAATGGAIPE